MNAVIAQVRLNPDVSELPGGQVLQNLTDGIAGWAIVIALISLVVSSAVWALGANSQNYQYTVAGKRGVMVAGLASVLIGAAPAIINFFYGAGQGVR